MTFRDLDDYDKKRRNTYAELGKLTKNGLDVNKNNTKKPSWEEYVAITAWSCYILDSRNTQRFKEFYELFEKEVNMSYAYVFYKNFIFRFEPNKLTFRTGLKNKRKIYTELPGHYKNGKPFPFSKMCETYKHWNYQHAQNYWLFYTQDNKERFKEFYRLFEEEGSMKHYIFFYTENFTYRMSKGLIEAYDKEKKEWGKVATYTLPSDFDFKSLVGCMITNHFGFLTAANGELQQFINYKDTAPRFLEFLNIIEKGVDVEDEE
jgi:hypothetical protein